MCIHTSNLHPSPIQSHEHILTRLILSNISIIIIQIFVLFSYHNVKIFSKKKAFQRFHHTGPEKRREREKRRMIKVVRKSNWKDLSPKEEKSLAVLYRVAFDEELKALEAKGLATTLR